MKYILATLSLIMIYNTCMGQSTTRIYKNEYYTPDPIGNDFSKRGSILFSGAGVFLANGDFVAVNNWFYWLHTDVRGTISCIGKDGEIKWSFRKNEMFLPLDGLSVTPEDEIIVPADLAESAYIFKLDSNGNIKWSKKIKGGSFYKTIVTGDGNIVSIGRDPYQEGSTLIKFTPAGKLLWAYSFDQLYTNEISETGEEELVITGHFYDKVKGVSYWVVVWLDQIGKKTDSRKFLLESGNTLELKTVIVDKDGNSVASGTLSVGEYPNIQPYGLLMKFNKDHSIQWLKKYESGPRKLDFDDMVEKPDGNWLLNGWGYKADKVASSYIVETDKDGNISRASELQIDTSGILLYQSSISSGGQIYYLGELIRTLPPKELVYTADDFMLIQADAVGRAGCIERTLPVSVSDFTAYTYTDADIKQDTVSTLEFLDLDVGIVPDNYITGYTICETTATEDVSAEAGALRLYPNPVSSTLSIDVEQPGYGSVREQTVDITDLLGRKLYTVDIDYDGHAEVDTQTLPPGMYIAVLLADRHQVQAVKFVVVRSEK